MPQSTVTGADHCPSVAVAPVVGVLLGLLVPVPDTVLGAMLALFAGFFLYIGAAELLPEAHRSDRSSRVVIATLAGVARSLESEGWAIVDTLGPGGLPQHDLPMSVDWERRIGDRRLVRLLQDRPGQTGLDRG